MANINDTETCAHNQQPPKGFIEVEPGVFMDKDKVLANYGNALLLIDQSKIAPDSHFCDFLIPEDRWSMRTALGVRVSRKKDRSLQVRCNAVDVSARSVRFQAFMTEAMGIHAEGSV